MLRSLNKILIISHSFIAATLWTVISPSEALAAQTELLVHGQGAPEQAKLSVVQVKAKIDDFTMTVTYDLLFKTNFGQPREGTFNFAIPSNSAIDEFGIWVDKVYQPSAVVRAAPPGREMQPRPNAPKQGKNTPNNSGSLSNDNTPQEWISSNNFSMRVQPIQPFRNTRLRLRLVTPATAQDNKARFSVPLAFGPLDKLSIKIEGRFENGKLPQVPSLNNFPIRKVGNSIGLEKGDFAGEQIFAKTPSTPAELAINFDLPPREAPLINRENQQAERFFEAVAFPALTARTRPIATSAIIVWDSSLSEENSHQTRLAFLQRYLATRRPTHVRLIRFANNVERHPKTFTATDFVGLKQAIETRAYDGATRLDRLMAELPPIISSLNTPNGTNANADLLIFTNAVDSYGFQDPKKITMIKAPQVQGFIITNGASRNQALPQAVAQAINGAGSVVDESNLNIERFFSGFPWTIRTISPSEGLHNIECDPTPFVFPGDAVFCRGTLESDGSHEITMELTRAGETKTFKIPFNSEPTEIKEQPGISRIWAQSRINSLLKDKKANLAKIENLSLTHQIASPFTRRVILTACEDYDTYEIPRPAVCQSKTQKSVMPDEKCCPTCACKDYFRDGFAAGADILDAIDPVTGKPVARPQKKATTKGKNMGKNMGESMGESMGENSAYVPDPSLMPDNGGNLAPPSLDPPEISLSGDTSSVQNSAGAGGTEDDFDVNDPTNTSQTTKSTSSQFDAITKDTLPSKFGFEKQIDEAKNRGVAALQESYLRLRKLYRTLPSYYLYVANRFIEHKNADKALEVLSNIIEIRPDETRWLRIYLNTIYSWGKINDAIALYSILPNTHATDPHNFRELGFNLEKSGRYLDAMKQYERVLKGKWEPEWSGVVEAARHDLARIAKRVLAGISTSQEKLAAEGYLQPNLDNAKMIVTVTWDTPNTDIALHIVEPNGNHIYHRNRQPANSGGRLSLNSTLGYGPTQYRNPNPWQGEYRFYIHYRARNRALLHDGTFVRADFTFIIDNKENSFSKVFFIHDQDEIRTLHQINFQDNRSRPIPADFDKIVNNAKQLMQAKKYAEVIQALKTPDFGQRPAKDEAVRNLLLGQAESKLKHYNKAIEHNEMAKALDPSLYQASYYGTSYATLAGNIPKALEYLKALRDALRPLPKEHAAAVLKLLQTDPELNALRRHPQFKPLQQEIANLTKRETSE